MSTKTERRRHFRFPVALEIGWDHLEAEGPTAFSGFSVNLSESGLLLSGVGDVAPEPEEWLLLKIPIPGHAVIYAAGRVLRTEQNGCGCPWAVAVELHGCEPSERDRIFAFLASRQRQKRDLG